MRGLGWSWSRGMPGKVCVSRRPPALGSHLSSLSLQGETLEPSGWMCSLVGCRTWCETPGMGMGSG